MSWKTSDMERCGQPLWLTHLYETAVKGIRKNGLPSETSGYVLTLKIPTLMDQAAQMRRAPQKPPGKEIGNLVV